MSTEENKALVCRFFEEAWNKGNLEVSDELISSECVLHYRDAAFPVSGEAGKAIIARIKDGKIVEMWQEYDQLGMLQQLGAVPPLG